MEKLHASICTLLVLAHWNINAVGSVGIVSAYVKAPYPRAFSNLDGKTHHTSCLIQCSFDQTCKGVNHGSTADSGCTFVYDQSLVGGSTFLIKRPWNEKCDSGKIDIELNFARNAIIRLWQIYRIFHFCLTIDL